MTARSAADPEGAELELEFDVVRSGDRVAISLGARDGEAVLAETDVETARRWRDRFEAVLGSGYARTIARRETGVLSPCKPGDRRRAAPAKPGDPAEGAL